MYLVIIENQKKTEISCPDIRTLSESESSDEKYSYLEVYCIKL